MATCGYSFRSWNVFCLPALQIKLNIFIKKGTMPRPNVTGMVKYGMLKISLQWIMTVNTRTINAALMITLTIKFLFDLNGDWLANLPNPRSIVSIEMTHVRRLNSSDL